MFGQVVCSEAALDACPNHNGIAEVIPSSHDAHLALQPQNPHTKERASKAGLEEEEEGKVQPGQRSHNPLGRSPSPRPQSLAQGSTGPPLQSRAG